MTSVSLKENVVGDAFFEMLCRNVIVSAPVSNTDVYTGMRCMENFEHFEHNSESYFDE